MRQERALKKSRQAPVSTPTPLLCSVSVITYVCMYLWLVNVQSRDAANKCCQKQKLLQAQQ